MSHSFSTVIHLHDVRVNYGTRTILRGLSLAVAPGELVLVEGATGTGKTTLVKMLLGALRFLGEARVLNTDLSQAGDRVLRLLRRQIGVVFQVPRFLDQASVLANVSLPLAIAGASAQRCRAEGVRALLDAGLAHAARKKPHQLSGGEQAKLQIARALIHQPLLVLADEPFAHLDPDSAAETENLLVAAHTRGTTILITTHRPTGLAGRARRCRLENGRLLPLES